MGTLASVTPLRVLLGEPCGLCSFVVPWSVLGFFCIGLRSAKSSELCWVSSASSLCSRWRRVCPDLAHPCMGCVWDMALCMSEKEHVSQDCCACHSSCTTGSLLERVASGLRCISAVKVLEELQGPRGRSLQRTVRGCAEAGDPCAGQHPALGAGALPRHRHHHDCHVHAQGALLLPSAHRPLVSAVIALPLLDVCMHVGTCLHARAVLSRLSRFGGLPLLCMWPLLGLQCPAAVLCAQDVDGRPRVQGWLHCILYVLFENAMGIVKLWACVAGASPPPPPPHAHPLSEMILHCMRASGIS